MVASYSTPATATSGGVAPASMWNAGVRDNFDATSNWTSYTPALTQGAAVAKTTTYAKYRKFGTTCHVVVFLTSTAAGTTSSAIVVGMPAGATASTSSALIVGAGAILTSAFSQLGVVSLINTTTTFVFNRVDSSASGSFGVDPAAALTNGATIRFEAEYETT